MFRFFILRILPVTGLIGFAFVTGVRAQRADSLTLDSLLLQPLLIQATRAEADYPVPHQNISAKAIESRYHAQDVPYLLGNVPSLTAYSDAGTGIGYTGLRIRGSDPTRINVTINGMPLNDAESQGVFWVDLPDLAGSAAEIQVQRGVGTSTNGAGAFGATLNVDLSRVALRRSAVLSNTIGSFNTRKHSVQMGTGLLDNHWAFGARASQINSDGYVDRAAANLSALHLNTAYVDEQQSFQAHYLYGREITYQAWYGLPAQYIDLPEKRSYNPAGTEKPGAPYPDEVDHYTQQNAFVHYKRNLGKALFLQLNGQYTKGKGYYEQYKADQDLNGGIVFDTIVPAQDLIRRRWLDNDLLNGSFALRWTPRGKALSELTLGGAWGVYKGRHFGTIIWTEAYTGLDKDHVYYDNNARKSDANLFLKLESRPINGLSTLVDLQLRRVGYQFEGYDQEQQTVTQTLALHFFNPKLGAAYSWGSGWSQYVFAGIGNREPNRDDYTQSTPQSRPRPETLLDLEAGLRKKGANWSAGANLFWMRYYDQLVLDGRINDVGAYIRANVPDSWRAGVELEAAISILKQWSLNGNVALSRNQVRHFTNYIDNWDTGGQDEETYHNTDLAFSPNLIAGGNLNWNPVQSSRQALNFNLGGKYTGKQYIDNTGRAGSALPSFFTAEAQLQYSLFGLIGEELQFNVAVLNLFDRQYVSNAWIYRYRSANYDARPDNPYTRLETGDVYQQLGYFPQAGRHWMATLRLKF